MKSFKTFLKQLSESYITEAISDLKKQYKNIPEDVFNSAIEQDPTYIPGSSKPGQYTLWILNLINNYYKNIKNTQNYKALLKQYPDRIINGRQIDEPPVLNQIKPEDIYKIKTELLKFNKYKKHLNKNINQFKDLPDLTKANNSIENKGISTNKKVLRGIDLFKKAKSKGLKIIFNNKNWAIGIPETKESSVVFADDTKWCTTQNSARYYEQYTKNGPLYINLDKKTGDLYQFHFESNSFMDSEDKPIDINEFFSENPDLDKFYFNTEFELELKEILNNNTTINYNTIPEKIKKRIKTIIIPNNIKSIEDGAFYDCTYLKSITIPNSVTSIGNDAFLNCKNLQFITIPNSVTSIGHAAFEYCKSLQSITIPNGIKNIGYYTFLACSNLKSIIIPDSVTAIGKHAFSSCKNLQSIKIPNSVTSIGEGAFIRCENLQSIEIPNNITVIEFDTFAFCKNLQSIKIPNSVTSIGEGAFIRCENLKSIEIPDSVTSIENSAFKYCINLQSITIPNSIKNIRHQAFEQCINLQSITIPDNIEKFGNAVFYDCNIKEIYIKGNPDNLSQKVKEELKYGCAENVKIYIINK